MMIKLITRTKGSTGGGGDSLPSGMFSLEGVITQHVERYFS